MTFGGCGGGCKGISLYNKAYNMGYEDCKVGKMKKLCPIIYEIPHMLFKEKEDEPKNVKVTIEEINE